LIQWFCLQGWSRVIKLDFDLNHSSNVINDPSIYGIHFDLSTNNIYIASWNRQSIYIYHTNDETTFNKIHTIGTSHSLRSITIHNDKIYTGTDNGRILVYNNTNNALIQVMVNMCSSSIWSVKFDCNDNMIYSCFYPPMVKIIGTNGINTTIPLNDIFMLASGLYIDSKNRLWIGGHNGSVVYT
jgi:DNA-binding beta-propeller fold protein YncE